MTLDIIALALFALFFIRGFFKGFVVAVFSVVGLILGIAVSLRLSQSLAAWLTQKGIGSGAWIVVLAYVALFVCVVIIVNIIARLVQKLMENMMLGIVNKLAGGVLYALFSILLCSTLFWLTAKAGLLSAETVNSSKTYPYVAPIAPWLAEHTGGFMPFVKNSFAALQQFFDSIPAKSH